MPTGGVSLALMLWGNAMPKLLVDGQVVAEIDQGMADRLLDAASVGMGRLGRPPGFQAIATDMSRPVRAPISIKLILEFPSPPP